MKASTQVSAIPFNNSITDRVDSSNIIIQLELQYMKILGMIYQDRKIFLQIYLLCIISMI